MFSLQQNYKLTKKLPEFPRFTGMFSACDLMPPRDQPTEKLPTWCKELKIREILASSDGEVERRGSIQRSSSVNLPVESTGKQVVGALSPCFCLCHAMQYIKMYIVFIYNALKKNYCGFI